MHLDPTRVVPTWTAFLALGTDERAAFLLAAGAYTTAAAALQPMAPTPVPALEGEPPRVAAPVVPPAGPRRRPATRATAASAAPPQGLISGSVPATRFLPLLGGAALDLAPRAAFADGSLATAWRPDRLVRVYVAGSPGLRALVQPLGLHAYGVGVDAPGATAWKVGTAADVSARMAELGRERYGSLSRADPARTEAGFATWTAEPFAAVRATPSPGSPVRVVGDGLEVALPGSMTPTAFDQALARALAGSSLAGWAMSAAGRVACAARRVDPTRLVRGTPGRAGALVLATELVLIRPRHDALRLVRVCEQVLLDHALAGPVHRPKRCRARP